MNDGERATIEWAESWFAYLEQERAHMSENIRDLAAAVDGLLVRLDTQQRTIERLERHIEERQADETAIPETLEKIRQALAALDKASEHAPQE